MREPKRLAERQILPGCPPEPLATCENDSALSAYRLSDVTRPQVTHARLTENLPVWQEILRHRLSAYLTPTAVPVDLRRSLLEAACLAECLPSLCAARQARDSAAMINSMLKLAQLLEPNATGLRSSGMKLRGSNGDIIRMPSPGSARAAFISIGESLADSGGKQTISITCWRHVRILNAHALPDGNGRLARAVFNLELIWAGMSGHSYVPLYSFMVVSNGGFEIRLREAEILGRWGPITRFLATCLDASSP